MEEDSKNKRTNEEVLIMEGLVSRIIGEAAEGKTVTPILDIARRIKTDALKKLEEGQANNDKFLAACDTIIGFIEKHPNKTVLDIFKENSKKS